MLDLVIHETERIDSRFLEPACGTGNFLVEILSRKLEVVERKYAKDQLQWEKNAFWSVTSIYGIDILMDNVEACRQRLFEIVQSSYLSHKAFSPKEEFYTAIQTLLRLNIIWGDALSLRTPEEPGNPIVFAEWSPIGNLQFVRRDFTLGELLNSQSYNDVPLFSDMGKPVHIPREVAVYPPFNFLQLDKEMLGYAR